MTVAIIGLLFAPFFLIYSIYSTCVSSRRRTSSTGLTKPAQESHKVTDDESDGTDREPNNVNKGSPTES